MLLPRAFVAVLLFAAALMIIGQIFLFFTASDNKTAAGAGFPNKQQVNTRRAG